MANNKDQLKADKRKLLGRDIESSDDGLGKQTYPKDQDSFARGAQVRPGQPLPASHPGKRAQDEAATSSRAFTGADHESAIEDMGERNERDERGLV